MKVHTSNIIKEPVLRAPMESTSSGGDDVTDGSPPEIKPRNEVLHDLITFIFIEHSMLEPGLNESTNVRDSKSIASTRIFDDIDRLSLMFKLNFEAMKSIIKRDSGFRVNECIERVLVTNNCWNSDHIWVLLCVFYLVDSVKWCNSAHFDFMSAKLCRNEQKLEILLRNDPEMPRHDGSFP